MGACCSKDKRFDGFMEEEEEEYDDGGDEKEEGSTRVGDCGELVRKQGFCKFACMFTQQGRKGVNQDAMTIWEDFTGDEDTIFCGVFDGHGPLGHKVARYVCDVLPSKLSLELRSSNDDDKDDDSDSFEDSHENLEMDHPSFSSWKASFIKAFKEMDEELSTDSSIDTYCSGTTAVTILKQGEDLIIANLGDSRAILGTRDRKKQLVPVQLTIDLKPNLPGEAERINNCKGRVFAMDEEPDVYRMWMPSENCPGLAMARAFGDFCLKDYGLISVPQVSYRKLSSKDEFIVIATDGVWDVLSNKEVVQIVASARKPSMAAKLLVLHAVQSWKNKYPSSKIDDCAVICLFPKLHFKLTKSISDVKEDGVNKFAHSSSSNTIRSIASPETIENTMEDDLKDEWSALEGVSRANTVMMLPRFATVDNRERRLMNSEELEDQC